MRLDKYISKALDLSRNQSRDLIAIGKIKVNDMVIRKKDYYINEEVDFICYNDEQLEYKEFVYYMLNKPNGYICATHDKHHKTVIDLLDIKKEVFVVGRLDIDTEGLVLLTNNGSFAHLITSPKNDIIKKYFVRTSNELTSEVITSFKEGLSLLDGDNEAYTSKEATLEIINPYECYVYISEGKFHQVKRMFEAVGNKVIYLKRMAIGPLYLDDKLKLGEYRELTNEEVLLLKGS